MSGIRTVVWAALVFALLVLPPAISAGQGTDPGAPAAEPPSVPSVPPADAGNDQLGGGGSQGDDQAPAEKSSEQPVTTVAATDVKSARKDRQAKLAASVAVSIGDNFYSPKSITVDVGDTVTWTNDGAAQHSATASDGSFDTGVFGPGGSRSHKFTQAGTFDYFCTVHGTAQSGTVTVAGSGGGGGGGDDDQSEAAAVASSDAAGSSSSLPSTGWDVLPPMVVGLLLLLAGFVLRFRDWFGPA